jgi:hypothetical protein
VYIFRGVPTEMGIPMGDTHGRAQGRSRGFTGLALHCGAPPAWPTDHRLAKHWSQPGWLYWSKGRGAAKAKLVSGDFYMTESVPECLRPADKLASQRVFELKRRRLYETYTHICTNIHQCT